jgi:hypothetical protein
LLVDWQLHKIVCIHEGHLLFVSYSRLDDVVLGSTQVIEVGAYHHFLGQRIKLYVVVTWYLGVYSFRFLEGFELFPFLLVFLAIFIKTIAILCELF